MGNETLEEYPGPPQEIKNYYKDKIPVNAIKNSGWFICHLEIRHHDYALKIRGLLSTQVFKRAMPSAGDTEGCQFKTRFALVIAEI